MQLLTRLSIANATLQETVAPTPWSVQLWVVDSECPLPPTSDVTPTEGLLVPSKDYLNFIAKKRLD
jgi:hypothetical protein